MNREGGGGHPHPPGGDRTATASSARISDARVAPYIGTPYVLRHIAAGLYLRNARQIYVPHMSRDRGRTFTGILRVYVQTRGR